MTKGGSDMIGRRQLIVRMGAAFLAMASRAVGARPTERGSRWSGFATTLRWQRFDLATGDTIVIAAQVGKVATEALLDSGSAVTIMARSFAARLGIAPAEQRTIRGTGGKAAVGMAHGIEVSVDGTSRLLPSVIVADIDSVSSAFGRPIDLILGEDMLTDRCVAIDFAGKRLALGASGIFSGAEGWEMLRLGHGQHRELLVTGSIAGLPPVPLIFDLGSSNALMLERSYVEANKLLAGRKRSTAAVGGVEGIRTATTLMADRVSLAGFGIDAVPALAIDDWQVSGAIGNVGLPVISQFDIVLDVTRATLWLRRSAGRGTLQKDRSGLGLSASSNGLEVIHVAVGGPAERAGWTVGERIVSIDGHKIDLSYTHGTLWAWRYAPSGTQVSLGMANGAPRRLILADYY